MDDAGGRGPFPFTPADLTFDAGETVDRTFVGEAPQLHRRWSGLDADANGGEIVSLEFTFDEPGTYPLVCIPHPALGVVGTITVRERPSFKP